MISSEIILSFVYYERKNIFCTKNLILTKKNTFNVLKIKSLNIVIFKKMSLFKKLF